MSSYAVVWARNGIDEPPLAGELELGEGALRLSGGVCRNETQLRVPYDEILGLEHDPETRIGRCRAITIFSRNSGELLIATVGGVGLLTEISSILQQVLGG